MEVGYPFYAIVRGIGRADVYHSHPECQVARSIAPCFRMLVIPAGRAECSFCAVHHAAQALTRTLEPPGGPAPEQL